MVPVTCYPGLHYKRGEPACTRCKKRKAAYLRHWRRYGPRDKWGLSEQIVDVAEIYGPFAITELAALIPDVNPESARRVVYRLIGQGRLRRIRYPLTVGTP